MAASIVRTSRSHGVEAADIDLLSRAHALAMGPRVEQLEDDHHPVYLHPGRTVLILLQDVGTTDGSLLAAAALTETEDAHLRVTLDDTTWSSEAHGPQGAAVSDLVGSVPHSGSESLAEDLVTASEGVRLVAVAERLDHLRHAHLRPDAAWRRRVHTEAVEVYLPIAERTHDKLAGRYRYWCRTFERRFL